jgi:thiol-disulfide isomerase/thioredoxin
LNKVRWVVVTLVVVVAGAIALWPRSPDPVASLPPPPVVKLPLCARQGPPVASMQGLSATCLADNSQVDVAQAFAGPVLVNVWATWCAPCQEELPVLSAYATSPGATPVMALAVESEPSIAVAMLSNLKVQVPSLLDKDNAVRHALKVPNVLPASFLIDEQGNAKYLPGVFRSVDDVRKAVGR